VSEELLARLRGREVDDVVAATRAVAAVGGPSATDALMDLLRTGPPDAVTAAAIEGLGALGDTRSIDLVSEYARHRRPAVRILALQSLSAMRDARVENVLADALRDSDGDVRSTAAQSLGEGGYRDAVPVLFQAFDRGVREACAAIGKVGDAEAAERLTGYLGRGDLTTLLEGLAEFMGRADFDVAAKQRIVERLLELAGPEVRRFLVTQLAETPNTPANRRLRQAMQDAIAQIPEE
jgi:HEAT repeat protein